MGGWERSMDRGMGYLGLLLIGVISWLADHLGSPRAATFGGGRQPESALVTARVTALAVRRWTRAIRLRCWR
jgi:hypothetical protein